MRRFCIFVACLTVSQALVRGQSVTVTTPTGDIVGIKDTVNVGGNSKNILKFSGIPYAEPPTGDGRFSKPISKARFVVPFQATHIGPTCYQQNIYDDNMSEDCLLLNIVSPDRPVGNEKFPVMIWIHGGGFTQGSANFYDPDYFSYVGDVIVITMNYRLAELGFMSFVNSTLPGNMGLWDQHLAIKWVNTNIGAFGGDVGNVTIFGESAGSVSVVYQTMYPGNRGLFQRAIAQSGSATASWAIQSRENATQNAIQFMKLLGCNMATSAENVKCVRSKSSAEINATMNAKKAVPQDWPPVADNDFVLDSPNNIMEGTSSAKSAVEMFNSVDLMIGVNNLDGVVYYFLLLPLLNQTDERKINISESEFTNIILPSVLDSYFKRTTPEIIRELTRFEYTDWCDPDDDVKRLKRITDMITDMFFRIPALEVAKNHFKSSTKSTYCYQFSASPYPNHLIKAPDAIDGPNVAYHADDLAFLFRYDDDKANPLAFVKSRNLTTSELSDVLRVSRTLITMWTNFAKTGNPNQPVEAISMTNTYWPQFGAEEYYLEITAKMTPASLKQRLSQRAVDFFSKIVPAVMDASHCKSCQTANLNGFLFGVSN